MTGSVENAKVGDKAAPATGSSPTDLLKRAVAGKIENETTSATAAVDEGSPRRLRVRLDARLAAVATVALAVGTSFGLVAAPRERSGEALARIEAGLEAGHLEASRLSSEIERLGKSLASLRDAAAGERAAFQALGPSLAERMARLEQGLDKKFAALTERVTHADAVPAAPAPAVTVEKRAAAPATALANTSPAVAASTPKAEPTQTASITETKADTKPKAETVEAWALRDVYDGVAILEDRKRRLVEVAPGESVPGLGRVESIERRGRTWVVVTKQGVITPQTW